MRNQLHHLVSNTADQRPESAAFSFRAATLTYGDLATTVSAAGDGFRMLGVTRGERIAVYLDKRPEAVIAMFGASAAGALFVPVNPILRPAQVEHIVSDCAVSVLVTSPDRLAALREVVARTASIHTVVLVDSSVSLGAAEGSAEPTLVGWSELVAHARRSWSDTGVLDVDPAAILYTSGSTGRAKGVVVSHRNLLAGAESVSHYLNNRPDDVILAALPFSFDAGFSQLTTAFHVGAHVVSMNYLRPGEAVKLCETYRVTGLTAVPPLWNQLADVAWPPQAAETMRYIANTGGRMPQATLARLRATFPAARPYLMYGLTEAFRSTYLDPDEIDRRPDSIGKAIPNAQVLVVRPDGSECDSGEEGELVHRGALVALGYWNDPERTAERFRPVHPRHAELATSERAVWSGDTAVRDDAGFLYFVGRRDDMIKTSGYRVSPTEIEELIYGSGLVRDAVAVGVDDPQIGQRVAVLVTPVNGATVDTGELLSLMRRQAPSYMMPSEVIVATDLPRSANGKYDRAALRALLEEGSAP